MPIFKSLLHHVALYSGLVNIFPFRLCQTYHTNYFICLNLIQPWGCLPQETTEGAISPQVSGSCENGNPSAMIEIVILIPCISVWAQITVRFQTRSHLHTWMRKGVWTSDSNSIFFFQRRPFWHCIFTYANIKDGQTLSYLDTQRKDKREVRL